ncbi:MAG: ABC transporter ATP-binding protein [Deltaproteobacteria bacterium]
MAETVIKVENLSKLYRIGAKEGYKTFRETLIDSAKAPFLLCRNIAKKTIRPLGHAPGSVPSSQSNECIWALKDVSFEVKQGAVIGIIGRNGAGKSTLLKILSKITEPTEGRVELRGRVGSLLEVGTGFHPELTGHENVYLYGAILGMDRWEVTRKFDQIIAFAELEKFVDTPVKRYSSGMYMRLAFAVAAHLEPEILLVDEVLAVGDAAFQKKCLGKMGDVSKEGRTVLFVSHNMAAIEQLCTLGLLLDSGCLKSFRPDVRSVIKEYTFDQDEEMISNEWINPGAQYENPWFKPLYFLICDQSGNKLSMPVRNDGEMWVQIEAEIDELHSALTVGYAIYSQDGYLLYWSYQTDESEEKWPKLHKGVCILRSRIPRRVLNEGIYRIELIGGLHFQEWLFEPGVAAPSIYIIIQGGLSDSPHWKARRPGLLAPVIQWSVIK